MSTTSRSPFLPAGLSVCPVPRFQVSCFPGTELKIKPARRQVLLATGKKCAPNESSHCFAVAFLCLRGALVQSMDSRLGTALRAAF